MRTAGGLHTAFDTSVLNTFKIKLGLGFYVMSLHGSTSFSLFLFSLNFPYTEL